LWKDYVSRFGGDGYGHFAQTGHNHVATVLEDYVYTNNLFQI
jgi:hypothetical protein